MKILKLIFLSMCVLGFAFTIAFAAGNAENGKALVTDAKLLGMEKACISCHPNNEGLEKAGLEGRTEWENCRGVFLSLEDTINVGIIVNGGKAIDPRSQQMQDIIAYLKTLSKPAKK